MQSSLRFLAIATFISCSTLLIIGESRAKSKKKRPNIIFIMADDQGKEWTGAYGAELIKTPNIDELARTGMKFENAYSMPQCTPTRITLMTGQYPWRNGWVNHYDVPRLGHGGRYDPIMNPSFARMIRDSGYATCAAGKWQINDFRLEPEVMVEAGFDEYCMWTGGENGGPSKEASQLRYWDPYIHTKEGSKTYKGQFGEDVFSDFIIDFMKKNKDDPMLIYYPMCLPHGPLTTTPAEPDAPREEQHKAMTRYTDIILKKITDALDDLEIRDNTIIIWTTDNGTGRSQIGRMNGRYVRGGKMYATENGLNAPFIVNGPGLVPEGVVTDALVDFTDLLPTFCDLAGAAVDEKFTYDGRSFAPLLLGKKKDSERDWIMGLGGHFAMLVDGKVTPAHTFRDRVIRDKDFKAYVDTTGQIVEIVDVVHDYNEVVNLIDSTDPRVEKSKQKFLDVVAGLPKKDASPKYKKISGSFYDHPPEALNKVARGGMKAPIKAPPATEEDYLESIEKLKAKKPFRFESTVKSLSNYKSPEWFNDAKFGIYIHWGVYSVPEMNEWYPRRMYQEGGGNYKHHVKTYGHPSKFGYKDFIPMWKAEKFDPDAAVALFKRAGAKYFTPCAVHHDNFDLWNSKHHKWNAANMGPKKDLIGMWREATIKQGLRFGVTTHVARAYSWMNVANQSDKEGPLAGVPYDGDNPEYDDFYFKKHNDLSSAGPENPPQEWKDHWVARMKDLIDNYHPDHFYFDGAIPFRGDQGKAGMEVIAHLYNHSMDVNGGKQEAVMATKPRPFNGYYVPGLTTLDYERGKAPEIRVDAWQTDDTIGPWGYKSGAKYKTTNAVVDKLIDIVSKNGNLLLNIPIKADGTFDDESVKLLEEMGEWMDMNGEGIYGTRPWIEFGEGKINSTAEMGRLSQYTAKDLRYTAKGDILYAFVMAWPGAGKEIRFKLITPYNAAIKPIESVTMLGVGEVEWKQDGMGLYVTMPEKKPNDFAYGFKITPKK